MNKAAASSTVESSHTTLDQPRQTAAFWFTSNFLPGPLLIGFLGPLQGLTLWQSLLAIIPVVLLASLAPARFRDRSISRLLLPIGLVLHMIHLEILTRMAQHLLPGMPINWAVLALVGAALLAFLGPPLLYRWQALLALPSILVFALLTLGAVVQLEVDSAPRHLDFSWPAFGLLALLAGLWQLALTPLANTGTPSYAGMTVPALWMMSLGALMASAIPAVDTVTGLKMLGEWFIPGLGTTALLLLALSMIGSMGLYGHAQFFAFSDTPLKAKGRLLLLAAFMVLVVMWNPLHFTLY